MTTVVPEPDLHNVWRLETPGIEGWVRSPRPDAADKFFMVSADGHVQEPNDLFVTRMAAEYRDRLPGVVLDPEGDQLQKTEGFRPTKLLNVQLEGHELLRNQSGRTPEARISDLALDGVDAEILFPNKGLTVWATPDAKFSQAMCRAWNDWAWETFGPFNDRLAPMACIATGDLDGAIVGDPALRSARLQGPVPAVQAGVRARPTTRTRTTTCREFEPLWDCIDDVDLPITFHVSTGRDPRTARSNGGAVINYTIHSLAPTMEPIVNICASGVAERHPNAALRQHRGRHRLGGRGCWRRWTRPTASTTCGYARSSSCSPASTSSRQGFASFQEDESGLDLAREHGLVDNFVWANDFPHHEGTWPYSAQAIERTMGALDDGERAKILGLERRTDLPAADLRRAIVSMPTPAASRPAPGCAPKRADPARPAAVVGVAETTYYKRGSRRTRSSSSRCRPSSPPAADAGIDPQDIDGFASYSNDRSDRLAAGGGARLPASCASPTCNGAVAVAAAPAAVGNAAAAIATGHGGLRRRVPRARPGPVRPLRPGRARRRRSPATCAHTMPYGLMSPAQMFAMKVQPLHARSRRGARRRCARSRWPATTTRSTTRAR